MLMYLVGYLKSGKNVLFLNYGSAEKHIQRVNQLLEYREPKDVVKVQRKSGKLGYTTFDYSPFNCFLNCFLKIDRETMGGLHCWWIVVVAIHLIQGIIAFFRFVVAQNTGGCDESCAKNWIIVNVVFAVAAWSPFLFFFFWGVWESIFLIFEECKVAWINDSRENKARKMKSLALQLEKELNIRNFHAIINKIKDF